MKTAHRRTSEILKEVLQKQGTGSIRVGDFITVLGDRAFALAILMFALPNSLPIPGIPGVSTIMGLPITFIGWQMFKGRDTIWIPYKYANKHFSPENLGKMINKAMPAVEWLERYLMPRWDKVLSPKAERVLGLLFMVLSLIIALPIPGGNFLPGLAMSLIALGMLEKDGLFVACACGFSVVVITVMYQVITLFFMAIGSWFMGFF